MPHLPVEDVTDRVTMREALVPALRQLPARQREVIVLRFYADLSVTDTARALQCSEGAVKAYTNRALTKLRQLVDVQEIEVSQR